MTGTVNEEDFDCASTTDATVISMDTDSDMDCDDLMSLQGICFNHNYNNMMESCPDIYRCPISKGLMVKPVMLHEDGHTYDEEYLQQWLAQNNISPLTGMPLKQKAFTRNYALQQAIDEFQRLQTKLSQKDIAGGPLVIINNNQNKSKTQTTVEREGENTNEDSSEIQALYTFLQHISLEKYVDIFLSAGFISMKDLCSITFPDLVSIGIPVLHARRLINSVNEYRIQSSHRYSTEITESIELKMGNGEYIDIPLPPPPTNHSFGNTTGNYQTSSMAPYNSAIIIQPGRIPHSKNSSPLNINVLLLGDAYVGKTSLRKRLELNDFVQTQTTSGVELSLLLSNFQGEDLQITIWDPAGQERYAAITKSFFRRAHAAAIVFSADDPSTWKHVQYWMNELENNAPDDIEIILICNKIDLLDNEQNCEHENSDSNVKNDGSSGQYSYENDSKLDLDQEKLIRNAIEVAATKRIPFYMTSAKSGECVKKAFEELVSQVLHNSAILKKMYDKREKQLIQKGRKLSSVKDNENSDKSEIESESESESEDGSNSYVRLRKLKKRFSWKKRGDQRVSRSDLYPGAINMNNVRRYNSRDDQLTLSVTNFMVEKEMRAGCVTMRCIK